MRERKRDEPDHAPCIVCGKPCRPFGYVRRGEAQVCSRACDDEYRRQRNAKDRGNA